MEKRQKSSSRRKQGYAETERIHVQYRNKIGHQPRMRGYKFGKLLPNPSKRDGTL